MIFCMLAKMYLVYRDNEYIVECDFYRDNLHVNNAMDRSVKKNDQSLSDEE